MRMWNVGGAMGVFTRSVKGTPSGKILYKKLWIFELVANFSLIF